MIEVQNRQVRTTIQGDSQNFRRRKSRQAEIARDDWCANQRAPKSNQSNAGHGALGPISAQ